MKPAAALLLALTLTIPVTAGPLVLADQGRTRYAIVLASNAPPSETYAAQELQHYLERISAVRLAIVTSNTPVPSRTILIGFGPHADPENLGIDPASLGTDGFVLLTRGPNLIIAGGQPRGTLNGIYTFLEEHLGVRWFTADVEFVPRHPRLEVPTLHRRVVPALEYREVFWTEMMRNGDLAARHRLNGPHHNLADRHGGPAVRYYPFVHSFDTLIPRELFAEHPDYFPLIDGQRTDGYVQRCLTHPEVLRVAIDQVRRWIREHPEANIISVSQNDTFNYCQCDRCRALDDAEGSPCASLLTFVNAIAAAIEPDHPTVRIDTLAYQYTRRPPRTIRPRPNVIIRLCSIECCFAHSLADCPSESNARFRDDLQAWHPVAPALYVWDYTPNFAHYQQIFPNFHVLQDNVRFFVNHGVTGLFEQGNYSPGGGGEMAPLRAYLLAKLLWNPDTDIQKHLREFTHAYYGRAAGRIRDYLDVTHAPVAATNCHARIFDNPRAGYLSDDVALTGDWLLQQAEQLADDDTIRTRVRVARLPIWYTQLSQRRLEGEARQARLQEFLAVARAAGVSHISESKTLDTWAGEMEGRRENP